MIRLLFTDFSRGKRELNDDEKKLAVKVRGWGGRIRTYECWNQNPESYHLTTPQYAEIWHLSMGPISILASLS